MENRQLKIRQLGKNEDIPYSVLLLADETTEAINRYIFDSIIFVLEENNRIIGLYALQELNAEEIEIKNFAVVPDFQGKGIGTLLLRDAVKGAKAKGFKVIIVGTGDVTKQLKFYQKMGFEIVAVRKNFFVDNYPKPIYENGVQLKDMVVLKKELK